MLVVDENDIVMEHTCTNVFEYIYFLLQDEALTDVML
jgi:hypothetical protein